MHAQDKLYCRKICCVETPSTVVVRLTLDPRSVIVLCSVGTAEQYDIHSLCTGIPERFHEKVCVCAKQHSLRATSSGVQIII